MYRRTQKNGRTSGHTASVAVVFVNVHVFCSFSKTKKKVRTKISSTTTKPTGNGEKNTEKGKFETNRWLVLGARKWLQWKIIYFYTIWKKGYWSITKTRFDLRVGNGKGHVLYARGLNDIKWMSQVGFFNDRDADFFLNIRMLERCFFFNEAY